MDNSMLTTQELADYLKISSATIRRALIPEGLPHYRISLEEQGHYRFELDAVKEWLKQRQEPRDKPVEEDQGEAKWVYNYKEVATE